MLIPVPLLGRQQPLLLWALTQPHSPFIWGFHLALNLSRTSSWKQPCQLGRCGVTETCFSLYLLLVPSLKSSALEPSALNCEGCGEGGDSLLSGGCQSAAEKSQDLHSFPSGISQCPPNSRHRAWAGCPLTPSHVLTLPPFPGDLGQPLPLGYGNLRCKRWGLCPSPPVSKCGWTHDNPKDHIERGARSPLDPDSIQ